MNERDYVVRVAVKAGLTIDNTTSSQPYIKNQWSREDSRSDRNVWTFSITAPDFWTAAQRAVGVASEADPQADVLSVGWFEP
jgi:hypothetical protein